MEQDQNNEKIFYALMQRIGADGRYQKILLIMWIFVGFTIGSTIFSAPFLLLQSPYKCPHLPLKQCQKFVCSLPIQFRSNYLNQQVTSLASQHGDYRCEKKQDLVTAQSFIYIGGIAGVLSGAFLSSCITKKSIFILTVIVSIIGNFLSLFSTNLFMGSIGLFLNFASKGIQIEMIYCYITETVEQSKRGKHQTVIFMFEALGSAMNGPIIYVLGSWKTFLIVMYIIPSLVILLLLIFFIQETVYDSLVFQSPEKAFQMIEKVAYINGTTESHCITKQELVLIKQNFSTKVNANGEESIQTVSMLDLFAYKSVRNKILLAILLGLFVQFNFDGPELMIGQFSMPVYLTGFILGISEVFSCIIGYLMVDDFERRKMLAAASLIGIIIGIPIALVANCTDTCTQFQKIFQMIGLFVFRMAMSFTYTTFILTQFELFPTQVRGMAVQVVSSTGYIAVSMIPIVSKLLLKSFNISVITCFLFNCFIILFFTYFIPQTYNNPAPDIIQELSLQYEAKFHDTLSNDGKGEEKEKVKV